MREILLRGKDENGYWHYGYYVHMKKSKKIKGQTITDMDFEHDYVISATDYIKHEVIPETVGQYTGLKDKNGKRIFEDDIVLIPRYGKGKHKTKVYFMYGKFAVDGNRCGFKDISYRTTEVIGNIHDNPELLKEC